MLIKRVSDCTKTEWDKVWDMNIYLFCNYLRFDIEYHKMEERELQKWKQNH